MEGKLETQDCSFGGSLASFYTCFFVVLVVVVGCELFVISGFGWIHRANSSVSQSSRATARNGPPARDAGTASVQGQKSQRGRMSGWRSGYKKLCLCFFSVFWCKTYWDFSAPIVFFFFKVFFGVFD